MQSKNNKFIKSLSKVRKHYLTAVTAVVVVYTFYKHYTYFTLLVFVQIQN